MPDIPIDFRNTPLASTAPRLPEPQPTNVPKYSTLPESSTSVQKTDAVQLQTDIDFTFGVGSVLDIRV